MSKLNELNGKEWIKKTKSWYILRGNTRSALVKNHPGKFPEELAERYIEFFTKRDEIVFDPFLGVGSTGVAAEKLNRTFSGIEINEKYVEISRERAPSGEIILGDSREPSSYTDIGQVDFVITSPPYWNMLKKKRGNSKSQHSIREEEKLELYYSKNEDDLGNIETYKDFLIELKKVFNNTERQLKEKGYMVVVAQNFRDKELGYVTFAWDLVSIITQNGFSFEGEQLWLQDDKQLGIWGFPSTFISNIHHHYCLIFRKKHA